MNTNISKVWPWARTWVVLSLGLAAAAPGVAQNTPTRLRMESTRALLDQHTAAQDWAGCMAAADSVHGDIIADWSSASWHVWLRRKVCEVAAAREQGPIDADRVASIWQPLLAHFTAAPTGVGAIPEAQALHAYWMTLRQHGHQDLGDKLEMQRVLAWLDAAQSSDPQAAASLTQVAGFYYGARMYTARMAQLHQLYSQRLGPGHLASLTLLRARIFNHRQWSRPADALALSDEFAALVARHHPGDERLSMGNRSERVGALSGVGRYADALDEGKTLLAWLQARAGAQQANIMRSAYNLASLSMEMADYDAAADYALLSSETGRSSPDPGVRQEALFPVAIRHHARLLRGDAGAAEDLKRALQALPTYDLSASASMFTLVQEARKQGHADTMAWASNAFASVIADNTIPMQAARALPLYLEVQAGPAGEPAMLDKGSEVLAYGLIGRDASLNVLAHFALARHVIPQQPEGAVWLYKRGAASLQALRQGLPEEAQGVQKAWLSAYEADLRDFIGLLIDLGRLAEAEQAIQLLREEELTEFRRRSRGALPVRREGGATLSFTPFERQRNHSLQPTEARLKQAAAQADARTDQKDTWTARVQGHDSDAQQALAEAAQALRALALQPAPRSARAQAQGGPARPLPPGVARLSYFIRDDAISLVVQTGTQRQALRLPHTAAAVNRAVQALRAELQRPGTTVPPTAATLYRWLVAPVLPQLVGARHLSVVPDGALRYVPFAALHDGRQYLVQRYSVSIEPIHTGTSPTEPRRLAAGRLPQLAAFGRSLPDEQHSALPGVAQELAALTGLQGARVQPHVDTAFTTAALRKALEGRPEVVHLATHFVLDPAGEEASYLLMGDGTRLPLTQLRQLPWPGVGLALLSACDSALALDNGGPAQGRELTGLASTLQAAGARHVMATLWRIDDASTARWMQAFYAPWQRAGGAPRFTAQHLARTQRLWLARHGGSELAHPHHWAAFTWLGSGS